MIFLATSIPHGSRLLLLVSRLWLWLPGCTLPGCVPWILWCCTFCIPHIAQGVDSKPYLTYHGCVMYCFKEELLDPCSYGTFPYTFPYCLVHFHGALKGMDCLPYCFHVSICCWVWRGWLWYWIPLYAMAWVRVASFAPCRSYCLGMSRMGRLGVFLFASSFASVSHSSFPLSPLCLLPTETWLLPFTFLGGTLLV